MAEMVGFVVEVKEVEAWAQVKVAVVTRVETGMTVVMATTAAAVAVMVEA